MLLATQVTVPVAVPDDPVELLHVTDATPTLSVAAVHGRAEQGGAFAVVVRKGDPRAGAVLVKTFNRMDGATAVYAEAFSGDGERVWMEPAAVAA